MAMKPMRDNGRIVTLSIGIGVVVGILVLGATWRLGGDPGAKSLPRIETEIGNSTTSSVPASANRPTALDPQSIVVSGEVIDERGAPMPNMRVTCSSAGSTVAADATFTNAQGKFQFENWRSRSTLLEVFQNRQRSTKPVASLAVDVPSKTNILIVVRDSDLPKCEIMGFVLDEESYPIAGATVNLHFQPRGFWSVKTGPKGEFAFDTLHPGMFRLGGSHPDYCDVDGAEFEVLGTYRTGFKMQRGGRIHATFRAPRDNDVRAPHVTIWEKTRVDGKEQLLLLDSPRVAKNEWITGRLPAGEYVLIAEDPLAKLASAREFVRVLTDTIAKVPFTMLPCRSVWIAFRPGSREGFDKTQCDLKITDESGALRTQRNTKHSEFRADGEYAFALPDGKYKVCVTVDGVVRADASITIDRDWTYESPLVVAVP
jgi:hypothetical protein